MDIILSDEDLELLKLYKWKRHSAGYAHSWIDGKLHLLHRVVALRANIDLTHGIDHKNGNRLDNRRENLRPATQQENTANSRLPSHNTSGFKGVSWNKEKRKWNAYIKVSQKKRNLGYFTSILEAAKAYDVAATEAFGEYAKTNKMMGLY